MFFFGSRCQSVFLVSCSSEACCGRYVRHSSRFFPHENGLHSCSNAFQRHLVSNAAARSQWWVARLRLGTNR